MQDALQLLQMQQRILLSGHLRADGDCLGAISVLYHALQALGKEVQVILPNAPDGRYGFLQEHTPWTIFSGSLPNYELLVVCDCNQLSRLGAMGELVAQKDVLRVVLDHHPIAKDHGWTALFHDVSAAASGLLALKMADLLGVKSLPLAAYEAAFVALMTDTGWLKYSNADAAAWQAAARLVSHGVNTERIYDLVYQQAEPERPLGIRVALENLEYLADGRIALCWVPQDRLQEVGGRLEDTDEVLDLLRGVARVEAVALLSERSGLVKLSLRSKHHLDVNLVAAQLGGGGHARAAGVTFEEGVSLTKAVELVRQGLLKGFREQGLDA